MNYYSQKQILAKMDRSNNIIGEVEKWEAHTKGILHKGFTIILEYQDRLVLQHRKHPAFDGVYDLTISSHPIYKEGRLQNDIDAIYEALQREFNTKKEDLESEPTYKGVVWYKEKDPKSEFIEHEMDAIYKATLRKLPLPNLEYCYDIGVYDTEEIKGSNWPSARRLAPWVTAFIDEGFI